MILKKYGIKGVLFEIFILLPVLTFSCSTPDDLSTNSIDSQTDPFQQNQLINRAVNLGNALEAPNEGDWGVTLKEEFFQLIAGAGFNALRIPIRWSAHAVQDSPYTIDQDFLIRVDWAIGRARANGLAVIINIHHYEEIFSEPYAQKKRFLAIWQQIAARYKSYPSDVLFEILNEPHDQLTSEIWNLFLADAISLIRETNPTRTLIVGTAEWGGLSALSSLIIPVDEKNIIVTFHYYSPFHFTHQGAEWVDGSDQWLGTTWMGSFSEIQDVSTEFNQIKNWAEENHFPIFLGEFGAYNRADMDSRVRWTAFVAREAERNGFSWAYWEFCSGFGIYDKDTEQWRDVLLDSLISIN